MKLQYNCVIVERCVAPLVGAWIEIGTLQGIGTVEAVAPLVGAWIEIGRMKISAGYKPGRSPRGSVD